MIVIISATNDPGSKAEASRQTYRRQRRRPLTDRSVLLLKIERGRVHAIAQTARLRAVREDVPQVGIALSAQRFHAPHSVAGVLFRAYLARINRSIKARPAGPRLELRIRLEQLRAAARATVQALFVVVPILAGKGWLRALLPGHVILLRRQLFAPFLVGFPDLVHSTFSLARAEQNRARQQAESRPAYTGI